jgi:Uma2 family endonuclease
MVVPTSARAAASAMTGKKCKPVTAPFDVTLFKDDNKNIVQPDIAVVCDPEKVDDHGRYYGTPSLVVEVLSESAVSEVFENLGVPLERIFWVG